MGNWACMQYRLKCPMDILELALNETMRRPRLSEEGLEEKLGLADHTTGTSSGGFVPEADKNLSSLFLLLCG